MACTCNSTPCICQVVAAIEEAAEELIQENTLKPDTPEVQQTIVEAIIKDDNSTDAPNIMLGILLALLLTLPSCSYKITWTKAAVFTGSAISGSVWGAREAYHADPTVFERHWGVGEYSFFGSKSWERKYETGRYLNAEGQPNAMRSQMFGNVGRDFWHTAPVVTYALGGGSVFATGCSKQRWQHKLLDIAIQGALYTGASTLTYKQLRR